jgi:cell volume regulation protein A
MNIPKGTLVMMVKRGKTVIVPNGQLPMEEGDILLCLSGKKAKEHAKH